MAKKSKLKLGNKAPDFSLLSSAGGSVRLSDFLGKKVVLYFYPKDNTSGCTQEACDFKTSKPKFSRAKTVILGVSPDSIESHNKFIDKFDLPFVLLSDPDHETSKDYEVWKEKSMYGRKYMGIERSTFLIDEKGKLVKEYRKVKVTDHIEEILKDLKEIK
jgi:peroxiredoxin Q/BCP